MKSKRRREWLPVSAEAAVYGVARLVKLTMRRSNTIRRKRTYVGVLNLVLGIVVVVQPGLAQDKQSANSTSPATSVKLNLLVTNNKGHYVDDIRQQDIEVFENGVGQIVSYFAKEDLPVSYCLTVDNSGSFKTLLKSVMEAASALVGNNKVEDEACVVRFVKSADVETVTDFTSDKGTLLKALGALYIGSGQTAFIDAVYVSADHVAKRQWSDNIMRRRALVVFSDGEDRASYYTQGQLFKMLRQNNVQVFVVGLISQLDATSGLIRESPRDKAVELLEKLARETGGRVFFPMDVAEIGNAMKEIAHDLHTQYVVGYNPVGRSVKDEHKVQIKLVETPGGGKRTGITRPAYYVDSKAPSSQKGNSVQP